MSAWYNEIDPYAAQWLQNLMDAGHIAPGVVDTRSIEDVRPDELAGYTQCHFFAGIGVWSLALRSAGWPDSRRAWTGSCPCQPFSAAGKGAGFADERHLWPAWQHLINQCRPAVIFGEQVASKDAEPWIDLVHADLEGMGYAFGCVPFPSAGIGAPHIRDRNYWVADADHEGLEGWGALRERAAECLVGTGGVASWMGDADSAGSQPRQFAAASAGHGCAAIADGGIRGLADTSRGGRREECAHGRGFAFGDSAQGLAAGLEHGGGDHRPGPTNGFWRAADWLGCTDGKWRPTQSTHECMADGIADSLGYVRTGDAWSLSPLAQGTKNRVGRLRAYGNAICAPAAQAFIESYCEARGLIDLDAVA